MVMMLLQKVVLVSEYAITEKIDFCNRTDGHEAVIVGSVGLTVFCNRENRIL